MKSSPKIIAVAVMILIFSVTVAAAAGSDSFDGFGVTLAELFSWDKPLAGENAIETDTDCAETDTDCRETYSDCESWTDAPPYFVSGQCGDNLYWSLDFTTGVLTISGEGEMYEYAPDAPLDESELTMPWYPYKRYISSIELSDNITSITNFAFFNIDNLNCVVLPNSIEHIGHGVFSNCNSLRYVHIPSNISYIDGNIIDTFAVICSNTEDCYAKEYADAYGIEFFVCGEEHTPMPEQETTTEPTTVPATTIKWYYCDYCGDGFTNYSALKYHINNYHSENADGETPAPDAGAADKNEAADTDKEENKTTEFATLPGVQLPDALKPTQPTTAVTWYYCSYCDKGFPSSSSLSNHINIYHCATEIPGTDTETTNICPYCGTMFDSVEAVDDHKTHCSERPKIICPYCNISFVDETIYYNHINNCTTGNKYADMSFKEIIDKLIAVLESQNGQWNDIESIITKLIDLYHDGASALSEAEAKELVADLEIILGDSELLAVFKERLNDLYSGDIQVGTTTTTAAYICDYCGLRFGGKEQLNHHVSICGKGNGQGISVKIKTPSVNSVSYGDGIILHAEVSPLPEGMKYEWRASNTCFDMTISDGGAFCTVTPRENGSTVFSIVVTDAEGNVVCESEPVVLKAKASIFDRIIAFFRNLFGLTKILPEMMK